MGINQSVGVGNLGPGVGKQFLNKNYQIGRLFRILKRFGGLYLHLLFRLRNYNERKTYWGIPQPAYFNSFNQTSLIRLLKSAIYVGETNKLYSSQVAFQSLYENKDYLHMMEAFFPTKKNSLEAVNLHMAWDNSWWNKNNAGQFQKYRHSDVLFADLILNGQGVFNIKKVKKNTQTYQKIKYLFQKTLNQYRQYFGSQLDIGQQPLIDYLIQNLNLSYVDYPILRQFLNSQSKQDKYHNTVTTVKNEKIQAYIQIPFVIGCEVPKYVSTQEKSFIFIAATFNESEEVFHPFDKNKDQIIRDKWQLAKYHFAATQNNDFIIREHLSQLHYASAIYTTAFTNLSKSSNDLKWIKNDFIERFSSGLLQINFLANLTLIDERAPLAEQIIYLRRQQSVDLIKFQNSKFNILQFNPYDQGNQSYDSTSIKLAKMYYDKISILVDYLFVVNESSWKNKTKELGRILYENLRDSEGSFDALPKTICQDQTPNSLKKIMSNLIYLWLVYHGETFSIVSIGNIFFLFPTLARKPLRELKDINRPLTQQQKQLWLPPIQVIKGGMLLAKQVTYRADEESIASDWLKFKVDQKKWREIGGQKFDEFFDEETIKITKQNSQRLQKGLFYLHWQMTHEMPSSLNI